ncbi:MAG: GNAT family N-acetyltransferase [Stellaceae bacterium]
MSAARTEIRRLLPADAALYRDIRLEGLRLRPEAFGSTLAEEGGKPLAWFAERLDTSAVFGAFAGAALLGIAGLFIRSSAKEAHRGVLWGMYVRPEARGAGLGRRLVEAVLAHARQCVEIVELRVVIGNEEARRLYAGLGFVEYGIGKNAMKEDGRYWDEVLMAKPLLPDQAAKL